MTQPKVVFRRFLRSAKPQSDRLLESADGAGAGHEPNTEEAQRGVQGEGGGGGNRGRPDRRRVGGAFWGAPEPDPQLEEATAGWSGGRLRGWRAGGGSHQ